ncbi:MAG: hypothetical protein WKG03_12560, partial [Telluria sp.]
MTNNTHTTPRFIGCGSPMQEMVAAFDWSSTPLGPLSAWDASLSTAVSIVLHSKQPMLLWWGPDFVQIYNDQFASSIRGGKHPQALGQQAAACWPETWGQVGEQVHKAYSEGLSVRYDDAFLPIERNGRLEKAYWTYSYTPVFGAGDSIGGVLVVSVETTATVLSHRRKAVLTQMDASLGAC